jgi:Glu-tRNA(Gln) amidotransferase subunit E-like FAD-binding protein
METHQVQTADLVEAFDELTKAGVDPDQITPEALSDYFSQNKRIGFIRSKLGEINESLANDGEIVKGLIADANKLELTEAEIAEVIAQVYGETPEKKLAKKIATNQKANRQAGKNAVKNAGSDPLFFDDI